MELVPVGPDAAELEPGDVGDVDPTVPFVSPDGPVALVPLRSRTTLLLTSQHWFCDTPLELEPALVPCALAKPQPLAVWRRRPLRDKPSSSMFLVLTAGMMPARVNADD